MAGNYTPGQSEVLSGVYSYIEAVTKAAVTAARGVVAYPFSADWGPVNVVQRFTSATAFNAMYNAAASAKTVKNVYDHAFLANPKTLLGYRMATGAAAKGTVQLNDDGAAESLTLETLYESARAFTAVVTDDAVTGGKTIEIVENGVKLMSASGANVAALEAALNASDYVRVASKGENLPAVTAGAAFSGGDDGAVITNTQYSEFLTAIEAEDVLDTFALDGVTPDGALITMIQTWVQRVRGEGLRAVYVHGGPIAWDTDPAAANTQSAAFNHRGFVNVGNGVDGHPGEIAAIYFAAQAASVPLTMSLADYPTPYKAVNKKLTRSQREAAKLAGTVVFVQKGDKVYIDEGVNTLTVPVSPETAEMGKIKIAAILDYVTTALEAFGEEYKRGKSNTEAARETYAGAVTDGFIRPLVSKEILQPGAYYLPDADYHGDGAEIPAKIDEAFFVADITPVDAMERVYNKYNVNF